MATVPIPSGPQLSLHVESKPERTVVHCVGRITTDTGETLKSQVKPLITENQPISLDFSEVRYVDSSGLGAIVALYASAKAHNASFTVVNPNGRVRELFSITRLGDLLEQP